MELFLVRHAQSANNAKPESQRVPDPPLTAVGAEQARRLAQWLTLLRPTRLISSPFLRALQTTDKIHSATGLTADVRIELHEKGGCYSGYLPATRIGQPGMNRKEIATRFPGFQIAPSLDGKGWWGSRPYENEDQARSRARRLLEQTCIEFGGTSERVLFVMHADFKVLFLEQICRGPLDTPGNTSVSRISISANTTELVDYNRVDHLPARLVTY